MFIREKRLLGDSDKNRMWVQEEEETLAKCFRAVQEIVINGYERGMEMEQTAANVLDHHFSSSESENTSRVMNRADKDGKKRKVVAGYCENQTVQMSQIQQC